MTNSLLRIGLPSNLRLGLGATIPTRVVENDVYNICERIAEIDKNLFVVLHPDHDEPFVVMEMCGDGEARFVKRYAELHPGILEDLRYMLAVPLDVRLKILDAEVEKHNTKATQFLSDEQREKFRWDFQRSLYNSNFTTTKTRNMPLDLRKTNAIRSI